MQKFTVSGELLQAIVNYLSTKPFAEVVQLIQAVQKETSAQVQPQKEEEKKEEKGE